MVILHNRTHFRFNNSISQEGGLGLLLLIFIYLLNPNAMSPLFMKRTRIILMAVSSVSMILCIIDVHIVFGWLSSFTFYTWFILHLVRPERTYEENWVDYDNAKQADEDKGLIECLKNLGWTEKAAREEITKRKQLTNH